MKLRIGQTVHATDGVFGELSDIVVDPLLKDVTHVVVQPHKNHIQARLVPIRLVEQNGDALAVDLDSVHLRQLERVAFSDYVRLSEPIELGDDWDIGTKDILSIPYLDYEFGPIVVDDRVGISYDRVPKGECEIRRSSSVVTSDNHVVGHVDGLAAEEDHITAVVVRVGMPGFRHNVLTPMGAIARVRNDRIELNVDREQFDLLPSTAILGNPDDFASHVTEFQHRAEAIAAKVATRGRSMIRSAKTRITRDSDN